MIRFKVILLGLLRSFALLPALIALACVALAFALHSADVEGWARETLAALGPEPGAETARAVLAAIATSTITVVSLVYSLSLVVFTLAASSIAPRLLERFVTGRIGQVTAGLFTGTFFYSIVILIGIDANTVPRLSLYGAVLLVGIAVAVLILFMREIARQITVDAEISRITRSIDRDLDALGNGVREPARDSSENDEPDFDGEEVAATRAGYVAAVDVERLLAQARKADCIIALKVAPGDFVLGGMVLAVVSRCDRSNEVARAIERAVTLSDVRTPGGDPAFSIHLLVEIALRALSPGVNDAYTAIACIDHLTAAYARLLQQGVPPTRRRDSDDKVRVVLPGMDLGNIMGSALHPLRRGAQGNVSVSLALIRALGRLAEISGKDHGQLIERHLSLVLEDARREVENDDDRQEIEQCCEEARARLAGRSG